MSLRPEKWEGGDITAVAGKKKKKSADNKNYNCVNSVSVLLKAKANSKPKTGFHGSPLKQG